MEKCVERIAAERKVLTEAKVDWLVIADQIPLSNHQLLIAIHPFTNCDWTSLKNPPEFRAYGKGNVLSGSQFLLVLLG